MLWQTLLWGGGLDVDNNNELRGGGGACWRGGRLGEPVSPKLRGSHAWGCKKRLEKEFISQRGGHGRKNVLR